MKNNACTFHPDDVTLLLTDITGRIEPKPASEREKLIQSGVHYSAMLPMEYKPSDRYISLFYQSLDTYAQKTANALVTVTEKIHLKKRENVVLVSLARAGTPAGVLIKRCLLRKYGFRAPHYTISIVRGKGIDKAAMSYILNRHAAGDIQFIDGWTGKGAILNELSKELQTLIGEHNKRQILAVLADPANITDMCGTHEDIPIASSFLNAATCGLMSRTVIRDGIAPDEFHGVVFYDYLRGEDKTYEFIDKIESCFLQDDISGLDEVYKIAKDFNSSDINLIKPGFGEAVRVLLRRVPDTLLIAENAPPQYVSHLIQLANEKQVPVVYYPLKRYLACGIIKSLAAEI